MDAFEQIIAIVARQKGYWTMPNYRVEVDDGEKRVAGVSASCPRWEFDLVAHSPERNEILAIERKSFLDSKGVRIHGGILQKPATYKLFNDVAKRRVVLAALRNDLLKRHMCRKGVTARLVLAAGKIQKSSRRALAEAAGQGEWILWSDDEIAEALLNCTEQGYENSVAVMTAKILTTHLRHKQLAGSAGMLNLS